jgi:inosine/xanthosine triphosphate pyrophosphatase family protein
MVHIKEQNKIDINLFAFGGQPPKMQGTKLHALYKLIQSKGEPIISDDAKLNGVKALLFKPGEYVAIIHTPIKETFYPCMLKTILLTDL